MGQQQLFAERSYNRKVFQFGTREIALERNIILTAIPVVLLLTNPIIIPMRMHLLFLLKNLLAETCAQCWKNLKWDYLSLELLKV